jgi:hypothetical protein
LPFVAELADLAREHTLGADIETVHIPLRDVCLLSEEGHPQGRAIGEDDDVLAVGGPARTTIGVGVLFAGLDLTNDADQLADCELVDLGQFSGLEVAARVVGQQIAHRAQAQPIDELLPFGRRIAQHRFDR